MTSCPNCGGTRRALYFGEQGWAHEERDCHVCSAPPPAGGGISERVAHRHRLANRRAHETIAIEHAGQRYKIGLGRELLCVDRGRLGPVVEVFVSAQKVNTAMDVIVSDGAILMSMLIQYGCPPAVIVKSMKHNSDGTPSSPIGRAAALLAEATQQQQGGADVET